MKKILVFMVMMLGLFFISCEEDCEKNSTGNMKVVNYTGQSVTVDVTWGGSEYNDERRIGNGSSTTYEVPEGSVKVWASYDEVNWSVSYREVSSCTTETCEWVPSTSRSLEAPISSILQSSENEMILVLKNK